MNVLTYTSALLLLAVGVAVLGAFVALLVGAVRPALKRPKFSLRLKRAQAALARADASLTANDKRTAVSELSRAIITDSFSNRDLIQAVQEHNHGVLSRCVVVAEALGTHAENLGEVEQLLLENSELQLLKIKAHDAFQRIEAKRSQTKKPVPEWTKADFSRREREVDTALNQNRIRLTEALSRLFSSLESSENPGIVYH